MLATKIRQRKLLIRNLMHRGTGIGNRTNLVSIELLPPIQRGGDVKIDRNHPHELTMVCACVAKGRHKLQVIRAHFKAFKTRTITVLFFANILSLDFTALSTVNSRI